VVVFVVVLAAAPRLPLPPSTPFPKVNVPTGAVDDEFFFRRMVEAIWDLSEFMDRSPEQVLDNLLAGRADTSRFRIEAPTTVTGESPIAES
jgi:hypothetical protein